MMGKASADAAEDFPLSIKRESSTIHRMTHVFENWDWTTVVMRYSIIISDSRRRRYVLNKEEQAIMERAKGQIQQATFSKLVTFSNNLNMSPLHQQPLASPMVHIARLLCSNVKITCVSGHLGSVMVMMTVVMVLTKSFTCAVRGRPRAGMGVVSSGKISTLFPWSM